MEALFGRTGRTCLCTALQTNSKERGVVGERTGDWDGGVVGAEDVKLEAAEHNPEALLH
jgi:hypothetical protein